MSDPGTTTDTGAGAIPRQETPRVPGPEGPARAELSEPAQGPILPRPSSDLLPARPVRQLRLPGLGVLATVPRPTRTATAAVVAVVLVVGLFLTATVRSGGAATRAEAATAAATTAAEAAAAQSYPLRPDRFAEALDTLIAQAAPLAALTRGPSWATSRWSVRANRLSLLDRQSDGLSRLADTARPLRLSMLAATSGTPDADRVHTLAADLNAYAGAARGSDLTYDDGIRQLAAAADSLRLMLAGAGEHVWTVCEAAAGPCVQLTVRAAQVTRRTTVAAGLAPLATGDVRFTGVAVSTVLSGRRLLVTGLLDVLMRSADPDVPAAQRPVVQVLSAVPGRS